VYTQVYGVQETIFSDQPGRLPVQSYRGNNYIMVLVEIDSNAILIEPIKNRNTTDLIRAMLSSLPASDVLASIPRNTFSTTKYPAK
jgi:hypothetical protein